MAFSAHPDLHTAAHEAAHTVQQRLGLGPAQGVGRIGDRFEQHADAVADRVVRGESAESLLDNPPDASSGPAPGAMPAVQMKSAGSGPMPSGPGPTDPPLTEPPALKAARQTALDRLIASWGDMDAFKRPLVSAMAAAFCRRARPLVGGSAVASSLAAVTTYPGGLSPSAGSSGASLTAGIAGMDQAGPSEAAVFEALYAAMDFKKAGLGGQGAGWTWTWADQPSTRPKTGADKQGEILDFGVDALRDVAKDGFADDVGARIAGQVPSMTVKFAIKSLGTGTVAIIAGVVLEAAAGPVGWFSLAVSLGGMLFSLGEDAKVEPTEAQRTNVTIVALVKDWLAHAQASAELGAALNKPIALEWQIASPDKLQTKPR